MYISYKHHKVTFKRHWLLGCPTLCLVQAKFIRPLHLWTSNISNVDWALPLCCPADCMAESSECSYRPHDRSEIYDQITHWFHSAGVLNLRGTRSLSGDMHQATYLPNLHVAYALLHENWGYKKFIFPKRGYSVWKRLRTPAIMDYLLCFSMQSCFIVCQLI